MDCSSPGFIVLQRGWLGEQIVRKEREVCSLPYSSFRFSGRCLCWSPTWPVSSGI
jgi:hypothetical protein